MLTGIFELVDENNSNNKIEFHEFIKFLFLLLKGSQEDRINFIFKFIAGKEKESFSFIDLKNFYAKVNNTFSNEYRQEVETEMAKTVFQLIKVSQYLEISREVFKGFLRQNPNLMDLFDMMEVNLEKGKQLKIENYLGKSLYKHLTHSLKISLGFLEL